MCQSYIESATALPDFYMYKKMYSSKLGSNLPQVVVTDFFLKINSPSAGRNSSSPSY